MVLWGPEEWQEEKQPVRLGPSMHVTAIAPAES